MNLECGPLFPFLRTHSRSVGKTRTDGRQQSWRGMSLLLQIRKEREREREREKGRKKWGEEAKAKLHNRQRSLAGPCTHRKRKLGLSIPSIFFSFAHTHTRARLSRHSAVCACVPGQPGPTTCVRTARIVGLSNSCNFLALFSWVCCVCWNTVHACVCTYTEEPLCDG